MLTKYSHFVLASRPHSVGLATNDSPAGLAAYILEKFAMWSGCQTTDTAMCLESCFSKDDLLTNVMIYWATHTITSSMRLYYEAMHSHDVQKASRLVTFDFNAQGGGGWREYSLSGNGCGKSCILVCFKGKEFRIRTMSPEKTLEINSTKRHVA